MAIASFVMAILSFLIGAIPIFGLDSVNISDSV